MPSRVLGLDFGEKRLGIALSDGSGRIAHPFGMAEGVEEALEVLQRLILQEGVVRVVVGLPRNMDGSLGPKAREVLRFIEGLRARISVPIETWDERLTTAEAERYLRESGLPRPRWRERVNQVAAQIILQSWLDARRGEDRAGEAPADGPGGPSPETSMSNGG